jgi:hypothetical protein
MSELASYSIQAVFFALVAVVVVSRSKKTDLYQFALISIWLIGVIAIYARYREGQVLFYSNDQQFHQQVIDYYLPVEGIHLNAFFGLRYVLTVPVYLVAKLGFDAMLLLKFIQLVFLLMLYRQAKLFLEQMNVAIRFWHIACIAGPITIFMSLLSLRDLLLAYCAVTFVTNESARMRLLSLFLALCLRPHLAVALAFGFIATEIFVRTKNRKPLIGLLVFSVICYAAGCLAFPIGAFIQHHATFQGPESVFSQLKFSRLAINFIGLQFLAINNENGLIVARSTVSLLLSRLVFFDTILIPLLFLRSTITRVFYQTRQKLLVLFSFLFFYGVVSQTTWNSTRQNIPFLACMGVLVVSDIEHFRKIKTRVSTKPLMVTS